MTQNYISCRLAKNFELPLTFVPERWLKSSDEISPRTVVNPYLVLPFSHGMRSCIARRFAEQNMLVLMLRVRSIFICSIFFSIIIIYFFYHLNNFLFFLFKKNIFSTLNIFSSFCSIEIFHLIYLHHFR